MEYLLYTIIIISLFHHYNAQIKFIKTMDGERFHENAMPSIILSKCIEFKFIFTNFN